MIGLSIKVLLLLNVLISFLLLIFGCYLVWKRGANEKRRMRKEAYKERTEKLWYEYFIEDRPLMIYFTPAREAEIEGYEEIASVYTDSITDDGIRRKLRELASMYLKDHYKNMIDHPKWSLRMNALARIADYGNLESIKESQWIQREKKTKDEMVMLLSIYALHDENSFIDLFLHTQSSLSEYECRKIFTGLSEPALNQLFTFLDKLEQVPQYALVDTAAMRRETELISQLSVLIQHEDHELRIRAAKAIYEIGIVQPALCESLMKAKRWEERLMAAKLSRHVLFSDVKDVLFKLLEDERWQVRQQAARTIALHKEGHASLQLFAESSSDRYAVETALEIIGKRGAEDHG